MTGAEFGATPDLRIGGHVSLGPKPDKTIASMRDAGFTCMQIHASSPRTWRFPNRPDEHLERIRGLCEEAGIDLYLHSIYLINLASADDVIYQRSIQTLIWNLETGAKLGAKAVTFHVGSHRGQGFDDVRPRITEAIRRILEEAPPEPLLLLENSAGAGDCIGGDICQLGAIMRDAGQPVELGYCIDTAHAFAMGHDFRTRDGAGAFVRAIDASIGLDRLKLIHCNDSKTEAGSFRDRHENIGAGCIGEQGFAMFLSRPEFRGLPLIMETPNLERRPEELATLRRLAMEQRKAA